MAPAAQTCATCVFFKASACVRYPPVVASTPEQQALVMGGLGKPPFFGRFPIVNAADWCGEWKAN
jgi:hypothetical protein